METKLFTCILCKKTRGHNQLETIFKDGSLMCKVCGDEIRSGFTYYVNGKEVSKDEHDKLIEDNYYDEEENDEINN